MQRKKLPIGIQTFSKIIKGNFCYVDKTALIQKLVQQDGGYYFLSRPRRFGKSLLVSTLKSLFSGEQDLFINLAIEKEWNWSKKHPVIHISFGAGMMDSRERLEARLRDLLAHHERDYDLPPVSESISGRFGDLIIGLQAKFNQQVVLLIDEYDKPILDNIVSDRDDVAIAVRDTLKGFYA
ncbi:MAG: AAA family ATPase, partial [Mariprofundales bacterium]